MTYLVLWFQSITASIFIIMESYDDILTYYTVLINK
jgi:hypothetical protein